MVKEVERAIPVASALDRLPGEPTSGLYVQHFVTSKRHARRQIPIQGNGLLESSISPKLTSCDGNRIATMPAPR